MRWYGGIIILYNGCKITVRGKIDIRLLRDDDRNAKDVYRIFNERHK